MSSSGKTSCLDSACDPRTPERSEHYPRLQARSDSLWESVIARFGQPSIEPMLANARHAAVAVAPTLIAEWDGVVEESSSETFWALVQDPTGEQPDLRVEIALEQVPEVDRKLIATGAHFYWTIEILDKPRSRQTINTVTFRPPLAWTRERRIAVEAKADAIHESLFG